MYFVHVVSPRDLHAFHEDIHATRVVRLSAKDLGTMSKDYLIGITSRIRPIWGIISLTLHDLLFKTHTSIGPAFHIEPIFIRDKTVWPCLLSSVIQLADFARYEIVVTLALEFVFTEHLTLKQRSNH